MSSMDDFTRWNRAGLTRFEYVDGNAATFLEFLREAMKEEFTDSSSGKLQWTQLSKGDPADETTSEKNARLIEQYRGERRDYAWEILRTFSRAVDVTLAHLDAYANEGYIGTATQWENVRRMVTMLDYHPAPPASAATLLALIAKEGTSGTVAAGWQVKNAPEDGSAPKVFETLADIEVHGELSRIHPHRWNQNLDPLETEEPPGAPGETWAAITAALPEKSAISTGGRGIALIHDDAGNTGEAHAIVIRTLKEASLGENGSTTEDQKDGQPRMAKLAVDGIPSPASYRLFQPELLLEPSFIGAPKLSGDRVLILDRGFPFPAGVTIGWYHGAAWSAAFVEKVADNRIRIAAGGPPPPPAPTELFVLLSAEKREAVFDGVTGSYIILPPADHRRTPTVWANGALTVAATESETITDPKTGQEIVIREKVTDPAVNRAWYLPAQAQPAAAALSSGPPPGLLEFDGKPKELASGRWLLCQAEETGLYYPRMIAEVTSGEKSYCLTLAHKSFDPLESLTIAEVSGVFATRLRPLDHDINQNTLAGAILPVDAVPEPLKRGRKVVIHGSGTSHEADITEIDRDSIPQTLTITPSLPACDPADPNAPCHLAGKSVIHANVVSAGHGETQPEKVLGSGRATEARQRFTCPATDIAFVADAEMAAGVRADIRVTIEGRTWEPLSSLNDAAATDSVYTARMTEDGLVSVIFGDGRKGRRLPTGTNNIRVRYRTGTGSAGNLAAGALTRAVKPHALVASFIHPLPAAGGAGVETVTSLRETAAASLMTFERAVSLRDFTLLAASHSSVWQANAVRKKVKFGRHETVSVVVVPAGGLPVTWQLKEQVGSYLTAAALPGVNVTITDYQPIVLHLEITVRVRYEAFDRNTVKNAVETALRSAFALETSKLGRAFYRSELFRVVEGTAGVENSDCFIDMKTIDDLAAILDTGKQVIFGTSSDPSKRVVKSIRPLSDQVVFVDESSVLAVDTQPFST